MELAQRKESEYKSNKNLINDWYGKEVNYAEDIQLMHYDSEAFLNGKLLCSQVFQGAYKLHLSNEYGAGMIFKIMPKYKLRQEGENVQFHDQCLLYNATLDSYINFSSKQPIWFDRPLPVQKKKIPIGVEAVEDD